MALAVVAQQRRPGPRVGSGCTVEYRHIGQEGSFRAKIVECPEEAKKPGCIHISEPLAKALRSLRAAEMTTFLVIKKASEGLHLPTVWSYIEVVAVTL